MDISIDKDIEKLINKQFEMIGVEFRYKDIPEDGSPITIGKVKDYWYNIFKFTEEQEKEWVEWVKSELKGNRRANMIFTDINLRFGLPINYKRKGELF